MFGLLFLLFLAVPVLEIWVIVKVGEAIGLLPTLALLIGDSLFGAWLMRSQGRVVWRRFREALAEGRVPAREVLDGVLVIIGGALQIAPGFVTDGIGLLLVLPPTRAIVRRALVRRLARRGTTGAVWGFGTGPRSGTPADRGDVDGTATEVDQRLLP